MIEARDSSVPLRKASTPRSAKGETAEVWPGPDRSCWGGREDLPDCHIFVKRYQWLFGTARPGAAVPHIP